MASAKARAHLDRARASQQRGEVRETAEELLAAYDKGSTSDRARIATALLMASRKKRK